MKFLFIANRFSLDLVNTIVVVDGKEADLLIDHASVSIWLDAQGLSLSQPMRAEHMCELKALRNLIRQWVLSESQYDREISNGIDVLNKHLEQHQTVKQLVVSAGKFHLETKQQKLTPQGLLRKVVVDFAELLAADQLSLVKQCSGERCILVFLDVSKSKRRRWCSMDGCGNRAKASAFYHNHKSEH